ncbi:MAG TPA: diacylglycerol kinase family protein [Gaiellaceae bacterium]|nr:diacylglycerol kinase family protein [Gaiellaceae bacterium]
MRAAFLVNPASAGGSTGRRWPELAHRAAQLGLAGDVFMSESAGHMTHLARDAAGDGYELLVVVGGDGTLNEVVNGIGGLRDAPAVALVPRGTGRDFARTFGIGSGFDAAVRVALDGETRTLDLGRISYRAWSGEDAEGWFANIGGAGISGAIAKRANDSTKVFGGRLSYLAAIVAVFVRWQVCELTVDVDGVRRSGLMHEVVVANGAFLGGGLHMCPEADPGDGLFDVLLIGHLTKRDLALTLPKAYKGKHLPHPKAELLRGRVVSVDAVQALPVQLDGEQPGTTPARFEIVPGALKLRVPS